MQSWEKGYVEIDGVKFFGDKGERVNPEHIKMLQDDPSNWFYLLKHFSSLSPEERNLLVGQKIMFRGREIVITDELIDQQLNTAGSNFTGGIPALASPRLVFAFAKKYSLRIITASEEYYWIVKSGCKDCTFALQIDEGIKKTEGIPVSQKIGECPVVKITSQNSRLVFREQRGANDLYEVNKIRGIPVPGIDQLIVVLRWYNNQPAPRFNTVYAGFVSPPFPDKRQTSEEFEANKLFWDQYAFIVDCLG
ncbi:MAG: hypothetical protein WC650_03345 [Candidatus Doudnabacteria bacterium]